MSAGATTGRGYGRVNQLDMKGRTAVVTGGARGIGRAITERRLASGAAVAIWDLDAAAMAQTAGELAAQGVVSTHPVELTDQAAVRAAAEATLARHGAVDILVNNAGITGGNAATWELAAEEWRRVVEVNLVGPYLACSALIPGMVARGYGRVVNIASVAGKEGNPNASHYSASKAGVISLVQTAAASLAGTGVRVNAVCPGLLETGMPRPMFDAARARGSDGRIGQLNPLGRHGMPDEIAAAALFLASDAGSYVNGQALAVDGGLSAMLPFARAPHR